MASRSIACPRCQGSMEEGYILDESYGRRLPSKWVEGAPEYWLWNLKVRGKRQLVLTTYRCRQCGFLESYARD
jgi:DNA-directed RNA polymerase subunit RPC12/RpoP